MPLTKLHDDKFLAYMYIIRNLQYIIRGDDVIVQFNSVITVKY